MGIMDNEGHDPMGFGNVPNVKTLNMRNSPHGEAIRTAREHERERLRRQPSNEVIEAAVRAMARVNENATGLKFSDLLRRMAVAAIGVYRSSNEQSGDGNASA